MKIILTNKDWDNIVDLVLNKVNNDNDYDNVVYYSDLEVEVSYKVVEDGYREEETNGYIQTVLEVELGVPFLIHDNYITELDWSLDDKDSAEVEIYKTLKQR